MMTIETAYKQFLQKLNAIYDEREANNIVDWVFESIAGIKRSDRLAGKQNELSISTIEQLNNALQQLMQHKPVQYVLQEAWFYKMKFFVNEHVLIPRPETEELVEWIIEDVRGKMYEVRSKQSSNIGHQISDIKHILDVGTGSGCISVSLKKHLPCCTITAIDISEDALLVAKKNAELLDVSVDFIQLDFLDETSWPSLPSFHIIVSNPPYIPETEKSNLDKNVVEHEPHIALFVKETDPFIFYHALINFSESHLNKGGKIFVEVHEDYAKDVQQIFEENKFQSEIRKDMYGRDRMIKAERIL